MKTSERGQELIKTFEGLKYKPYKLAGESNYTVGYGHVSPNLNPNKRYSKKEIEAFFEEDLQKFEANVSRYDKLYHWNANEFDALVCFAYNIGAIDSLVAKGKRSRAEIEYYWLRYCRDSRGVILEGLSNRRKIELELFKTPVSSGLLEDSLEALYHVEEK
ncbi:MAG: lysozyme [Clostridia bacterium]|nr:lysozyme [Clostridia bacterium]